MKNTLPINISKYTNKYALPLRQIVCSQPEKIKIAVVVPAIKEFENIKNLLASLAENDKKLFDKVIILFVVNNLKSSDSEIKTENEQIIKLLRRIINQNPIDNFEKTIIKSGLNIAYVDASSECNELEEKYGGVGLARKIGMDAILNYFDYNSAGKNILACLDADCTVEQNYLSIIYSEFSRNNYSAAYVNFEHKLPSNNEQKSAIINYEIFLHYYVLGLAFAQSPYAFHSIGSTMICDADSYVKVEGMNKKKAAEDFYFMQKLAKVTEVNKINGTTVYPSGRGSWRVPFGTGQRVNRFLEQRQNEYLLYSPISFKILKDWLEVYNSNENLSSQLLLKKAQDISESLFEFLNLNNFLSDCEKIINNSKSKNQLQKQKKMWFDGFKTLKLIHYLRDNCCPPVHMFEAVDTIFKMMNISPIQEEIVYTKIPSLDVQVKYLNKLREIA